MVLTAVCRACALRLFHVNCVCDVFVFVCVLRLVCVSVSVRASVCLLIYRPLVAGLTTNTKWYAMISAAAGGKAVVNMLNVNIVYTHTHSITTDRKHARKNVTRKQDKPNRQDERNATHMNLAFTRQAIVKSSRRFMHRMKKSVIKTVITLLMRWSCDVPQAPGAFVSSFGFACTKGKSRRT